MTTRPIAPYVLSGGAGTRLWPASRAGMAKQLVPVLGEDTLLQKTVERLETSAAFGPVTVIGAYDDRFILRDQLAAAGSAATVVVEPCRRDTLAAVLLAAEVAHRRNPGSTVAVVPSDHLIDCPRAFAEALQRAADAVAERGIAVVGVEPTEPSTAYGYIKPGADLGGGAFAVERFVEKPAPRMAETLISEEGCLWNAGVFCFNPAWLIEQVSALEPKTVAAIRQSVDEAENDLGFLVPSDAFAEAKVTSLDHGFMEHTREALVVPASFQWSDVGDWKAVWEASDKDETGVAIRGDGHAMKSKNTLIHASGRMVCTVGVENLAVVETPDAVLVLSLDAAQEVKGLVKGLTADNRREANEHLRSHRPWGWYQTVDLGNRFRVKRISVKPGAKLSLQRHHHRAEHWVVVRGTADVTVGQSVRRLHENESVYIPLGEVHRLANPGKIDLELVEVQSGTYLEEDDIERLDDAFGRVENLEERRLAVG